MDTSGRFRDGILAELEVALANRPWAGGVWKCPECGYWWQVVWLGLGYVCLNCGATFNNQLEKINETG